MLKPRPGIMDIAPYRGGDAALPGQARVIRLASNESALGPSPLAVRAYRRLSDELATEVDRALQRDFGISKAEFGILVTLQAAPGTRMRVTELADHLDWEKSRVAHQLTRMERRGLLERSESGAAGRRWRWSSGTGTATSRVLRSMKLTPT